MRAGPKLAWLQLIQQRGHFAAALSGVAFAVTLMFSQIGLRDSLVNASIRLYRHLRSDIIMTSWEYHSQRGGIPSIARHRFAQVLGAEGVESCSPLQIGVVSLKNTEDFQEHQITLVGFNPTDDVWDLDDKREDLGALREQGAVLFDEKSRGLYGPMAQMFAAKAPVPIIAAKHRVNIVGLIDLGPGFNNDGYMFSSDATYDGLSMEATALPVMGVVRLKTGADPKQVLTRLRGMMPNDVRFVERDEFLEQEKQYWLTQTPVGILFSAFLILGLIIGSVVVYQILYSDVTSHLPEYATMKAMGYSDRKLFQLVLLQAVYLSNVGFVPGAIFAQIIFILLEKKTLLPFAMTLERSCQVYLLTVGMCGISAAIAMLALRNADPAEIF
jgi:putative ABC transport system permease protein